MPESKTMNPKSDFDITGTVVRYLGDGEYQVRFNDGAEVVARPEGGGQIGTGVRRGLGAVAGGWIMREIGSNS